MLPIPGKKMLRMRQTNPAAADPTGGTCTRKEIGQRLSIGTWCNARWWCTNERLKRFDANIHHFCSPLMATPPDLLLRQVPAHCIDNRHGSTLARKIRRGMARSLARAVVRGACAEFPEFSMIQRWPAISRNLRNMAKLTGYALLVCLLHAAPAAAIDNGLGRTPPMGWRSWVRVCHSHWWAQAGEGPISGVDV